MTSVASPSPGINSPTTKSLPQGQRKKNIFPDTYPDDVIIQRVWDQKSGQCLGFVLVDADGHEVIDCDTTLYIAAQLILGCRNLPDGERFTNINWLNHTDQAK